MREGVREWSNKKCNQYIESAKFMFSSQTHHFINRYTFPTFHCGEIQEIGNRDFFIN